MYPVQEVLLNAQKLLFLEFIINRNGPPEELIHGKWRRLPTQITK
jgi:hypothetical protein